VLYYTFGQYNSSAGTINGIPAGQTQWGTPTAASIFQDIESDNWNGSTPPTYGTPSTYGTTGYYIQRSTGNVYFNNGIFRGDLSGATGSFTGNISGGANINITGNALFNGAYSSSGSTYAVVANASYNANGGVIGYANGILQAGVLGQASSQAYGGVFQTSGSSAALQAYSSGTGAAFNISGGTMATSNNTLVTNLYSQYTYYLKRQGSGSGDIYFYTGPATGGSVAAFSGTNKPGPTTGASNTWIEVYIGGTSYQIPVWAT
jgi:hypothetical protein